MDPSVIEKLMQFGFAGFMALALLWLLFKEGRELRKSFFSSASRMEEAQRNSTDQIVKTLDKQTNILQYMAGIPPEGIPPGYHDHRRSDDTPPSCSPRRNPLTPPPIV